MKTKIQLIEKTITERNQNVRISDDFDIGFERVEGIAVLSNVGTGHIFRSFTLGGVELFPKNFEVEFLQSNSSVNPNERFFTINEKANGTKIEIDYVDGAKGRQYPYDLKIYLKLTNET